MKKLTALITDDARFREASRKYLKLYAMRKCILAIAAVLITISATAQNAVTVVDADRAPVVGASVISANGLILGFTDAAGAIKASERDYPLSVRCLGYEAATVAAPCDTVYMQDATFSLPEMVVSTAGRPITRVVTYARGYFTASIGNDTVRAFGEYMLEYFFADGKVKGYKKSDSQSSCKASRLFLSLPQTEDGDSLMQSGATLMFYLITCPIELPHERIEETEAIRGGAATDTVPGKYGPEFIYRKNERIYSVEKDELANYKNHSRGHWLLKLLGFNMIFKLVNTSDIYAVNDSGKYDLYDYIYGSQTAQVIGKGKVIKWFFRKNMDVDFYGYNEQYPVSIERLTVEDYKEMRANRKTRKEEFRVPDNVLPLAPAIQVLAERKDLEVSLSDVKGMDESDEAGDE
ncbi:MAG: hypothetical protein K2M12_09680 [Muribaculaceae bacterium]|nr:hypothetical protein [Muribaculaceae bacterium]